MMNRIKYWRDRRGYSMQQLAERVDPETTASTINKLEKGQQKLTQGWMMRLAEALGIEQRDLLEEGAGIAGGFFDNVKPFVPGPKDHFKPKDGTAFFEAINDDLDEQTEDTTVGRILVFNMAITALKNVKPLQVCLFDLYDKSPKPKVRGHVAGIYMPPNKLTSNSKGANWIIRLDDEHLLYTPKLRGVLVGVLTKHNS
jgi:transcriptional regulator with XRE-family HTH domain